LLFAVLLLYCLLRTLVAGLTKYLWYDEILTLAVSRQDGWQARVEALRKATDGLPPLFYTIEHYTLKLSANTEIALRLPSLLGLLVTLICVFVFAKRRGGEWLAVLCAGSLLATRLVQQYNIEARPYSMVVACIAFALVCYQRAPSGWWIAGLACSLALAGSLHHLAILATVPFVLAEFVYLLRARKLRWRVWTALACVFVPLLFTWRLLAIMKATYSAHYWVRYDFSFVPETYGAFLITAESLGVGLLIALIAIVVRADFLPEKRAESEAERTEDLVEGTLLIGLLLLPVIAFVALKIVGGPLLTRYVLSGVLGMALAISCVRRAPKGAGVILFAAFGFLALIHELLFWKSVHGLRVERPTEHLEALLESAGHRDLPVAIADGIHFLPLELYASPRWKDKLVYLVDPGKAVQYVGSDTVDRNFVPLRQYLPYNMPNFPEFARTHREFLMYVESGESGLDWLAQYLPTVSKSMQVVSADAERKLYLVKLKDGVLN